ncbi:MAG: transcriptional coactivator p15/PC4 family protein [Proteobacteria bacterium]|nr:transcriptional coactivator p15/PC4 family protein [Pseudomonadota bacterium]
MVLGEIQKSTTEIIRVSKESFKGKEYLDIRIYFINDEGEWKPTKKGVTLSPDKAEELIEILQTLKK